MPWQRPPTTPDVGAAFESRGKAVKFFERNL